MSLMEELYNESMESVKYTQNSPIKGIVVELASNCQNSFAENKDNPDDLFIAISNHLEISSDKLRKASGMDISIVIDREDRDRSSYTVHVDIPKQGSTPSVLYKKLSDKQIEAIISGEVVDTTLGKIDYATHTVGGYFSTIPFTMDVGLGLFDPELLDRDELAAVLIHEIGHVWDFLDSIGEVSRSAAIASYTRKTLSGNYHIEKKLDLIRLLDPKLASGVDDPSQVGDEEILTLVTANAFAKKSSLQRTAMYEKVVTESMADNFATMNGLGYPLATAMRKLERNRFFLFTNKQYRPKWTGIFSYTDEVILSMEIGAMLGGAVISSTLGSALMFGAIAKMIPFGGSTTPKDRLEKIRQGMIQALRDKDVSSKDKEMIAKDLKALDKEIKNLNIPRYNFLTIMKDIITDTLLAPNKRYKETRVALDSLDNNRLFELSQRLKIK